MITHCDYALVKFSLERVVPNKDRDSVFDVFSNFENYQKLFPQHFPSIRVRSVRGDTSVVEQHVNLGNRDLLIMAKHVLTRPVLHEIFVIGGHAKGSHIKEEFIELDAGTKILVDVDLKLKSMLRVVSNPFQKNTVSSDYAKILDDFVASLS